MKRQRGNVSGAALFDQARFDCIKFSIKAGLRVLYFFFFWTFEFLSPNWRYYKNRLWDLSHVKNRESIFLNKSIE